MRAFGVTAVALALAALAGASTALAGTASVEGTTLKYVPNPQGDPAEGPSGGGGIELHIVQDSSEYEFATTGNELLPGPGCHSAMSSIPGLAPLAVRCSTAGVTSAQIELPYGVRYSSGEDAGGPRAMKTPETITAFPQAATNLIHGGAGDDTITGSAGNELIYGEDGRDTIDAGAGDDTIYIRDGKRDRVTCGPGNDRVVGSDQVDIVAADCEVGRLLDRIPPSVVLGIAHGQSVRAALAGGVKAVIHCSEPCTAKFKLRLGRALIGTATANVPKNKRTRVPIPLSTAGKSKLRHGHGNARLTLRARVSDASGNVRPLVRHGSLSR